MRALVIACLLVGSSAAVAEPSPQDQAKAHFKQGKAYQDAGLFDRAIDEYKAAFEIDHKPEMLFNIGQVHRLAGQRTEAIDYFQRYLAERPDGNGATEARTLIAVLTKELDEQKAKDPTPPPPTVDPVVVVPPPPPPERPRTTRSSAPLRIAGIATAGVGVLGVGLGVKLGLDARAASTTLSEHSGTWTDTDRARYEDGEAANRNMKIAYAVGGGLVIIGGVMYWLGARTHVVPTVTAQTAGLAMWGRF